MTGVGASYVTYPIIYCRSTVVRMVRDTSQLNTSMKIVINLKSNYTITRMKTIIKITAHIKRGDSMNLKINDLLKKILLKMIIE